MTLNEKIVEVEKWADPYYEKEIEDDGTIYFACYPSPGVMEEWKFDANGNPLSGWSIVANCPAGMKKIF